MADSDNLLNAWANLLGDLRSPNLNAFWEFQISTMNWYKDLLERIPGAHKDTISDKERERVRELMKAYLSFIKEQRETAEKFVTVQTKLIEKYIDVLESFKTERC